MRFYKIKTRYPIKIFGFARHIWQIKTRFPEKKWKTRGLACNDAVRKIVLSPLTDDSAPLS
jgi:hypothetical protein